VKTKDTMIRVTDLTVMQKKIVDEASYQIEIIKASYFFSWLKKKLNKQTTEPYFIFSLYSK
jgi:hypothetical protein